MFVVRKMKNRKKCKRCGLWRRIDCEFIDPNGNEQCVFCNDYDRNQKPPKDLNINNN